jgi:LPS-assembly lipoprotein
MWSSSPATSPRRAPVARRRQLLAALSLAPGLTLLAGCGFRPLYAGPGGEAVAEELAAIEVQAPLTRLGSFLQNQLIDDLNPAGLSTAKRYRLDVRLRRSRQALAIQLDDTITRYDLTLAAFFTLRDIGDAAEPRPDDVDEVETEVDSALAMPDLSDLEPDDPLADRDDDDVAAEDGSAEAQAGALYRSAVRRVASYNVIREPFATLIAEQDAEQRAAIEVSRSIRTLLTIHFETSTA